MTLFAVLFLSRAGGRILWKTGRLYGHTIFSNPATVQIYDAFTHIPLDCGALWILDETAFSYHCHEMGIIGLFSSTAFSDFFLQAFVDVPLQQSARCYTLGGNGMNENHTMHIQSDSLTFWAQAYIFTHAWGVYLLCCLQFLFLLLFTTLHTQGKKFMAGRGGRFGVFVI
jgi:hypothetical protein